MISSKPTFLGFARFDDHSTLADLSLRTQIRSASEPPTRLMSSDFSQGHFWISSCLPTIRELACFAEIAELLGADSAPNVSELNQCG